MRRRERLKQATQDAVACMASVVFRWLPVSAGTMLRWYRKARRE